MLQRTRWNRKEAAEILGISYKALLYKIKENGLDKSSCHMTSSAFFEDADSRLLTAGAFEFVLRQRAEARRAVAELPDALVLEAPGMGRDIGGRRRRHRARGGADLIAARCGTPTDDAGRPAARCALVLLDADFDGLEQRDRVA